MLREAGRRFLVYLTLATVAVAQPMLDLYGRNLAVFTTAGFSGVIILVFALVVVVLPPVVLTALDTAVTRLVPSRGTWVHAVLVFLCCSVCARSLLNGVSLGGWWVDATVAALLSAAVTIAYSRFGGIRRWVAWTSPAAVAVMVVFVVAVSSLVWPPPAEEVDAGGVGAESFSVMWVQLDEAPLFPLVGTSGEVNAARFPGFAKLASQSTWYRNVLGVSQDTSVAVPAMLSGLVPDYGLQPVASQHPHNAFVLAHSLMRVDAIEAATFLCPYSWCREASVDPAGPDAAGADQAAPDSAAESSRASFGSFVRDALVVLGHRILPTGLRGRLPAIDESWGSFGREADPAPTTPETGTGTDEPAPRPATHAARIAALEAMAARAAGASLPTFRFVHVMLPHRPWVLAPDLRKSGRPVPDPRPPSVEDRRRDGYQSHLNQYVALDKAVGEMVDTLRSSANWDKLMLIVTADHGLTFVPGESYRDKVNPSNRPTLEDIYRVPLFVKYPGQRTPAVDDCTASVLDILPTLEGVLGADTGWVTDGADLRSSCPVRASRTVTWPGGSATLTSGVDGLLERVRWYGRWVDPDGDVDSVYRTGRAGKLLGSPVPDAGGVDDRFDWVIDNLPEFDSVGEGRFAPVPTRMVGRIRSRTDLPWSTEVLVAVNGVFVGEVREVAGLRAGQWTYFACSLLSRLIGPGRHEISLWSVVPRGAALEVRRIG